MHILLPILGAIVVSATTSAASVIQPYKLTLRDEDPGDSESCSIDDGEDGEYEEDFYIREDCNLISDDTDPGLKARAATKITTTTSSKTTSTTTSSSTSSTTAAACPTYPVINFPCDQHKDACKSMCFSRYCKGKHGAYPDLLHRGASGSPRSRRGQGGYKSPSDSKQPCNPKNIAVDHQFNEKPTWTSMDEFPMALMIEGGRDGDYGPGFRCIDVDDNKSAGAVMDNLLEKAGVGKSNTPSTSNEFDIQFTGYSKLGVDWCNIDKNGKPTSKCENDGHQFIAQRKSNDRGWDYLELKNGLGWTGTKP